MRAFACLIFIALIYTIQGVPSPYIVGGKDAAIGKFPYQVSIRVWDVHAFCSGSIINNFNVLTSASCVSVWHNSSRLEIHVGTNFLNVSGDVYDIENVVIHKDFNGFIHYDIALVHLKTPIKYNTLVQPINLMTSDKDLEFESCTLFGFGSTEDSTITKNNLQEIESIVFPQKMCKQIHPKVTNTEICTINKAGEGPCIHDIGGPLVANEIQIGIITIAFCGKESPNVYTRVSSYIPWIYTHLKN